MSRPCQQTKSYTWGETEFTMNFDNNKKKRNFENSSTTDADYLQSRNPTVTHSTQFQSLDSLNGLMNLRAEIELNV